MSEGNPEADTVVKPFNPDSKLIFKIPPPLDPQWLAYEKTVAPQATVTDLKVRQQLYAQRCRDLNAHLLAGRDQRLAKGLVINDIVIAAVPVRSYFPVEYEKEKEVDVVVYYHGGGLYVGDLDSEDMACRLICKELHVVVYSVAYRLMPDFTADDAFNDALTAFYGITELVKAKRLVVMGSSSGGQLAAMVSQAARHPGSSSKIHGVALRGPVTCDATENGVNLPARFKEFHHSMSPAFHTSLFGSAAVTAANRVSTLMPLEGNLKNLPPHWIQVSTNDVYYSDGILYAEALRENDVEVKLDVVVGYPHTFWLKAPELERAVKTEADMIRGLKWLLSL